MPRKLEAGLDGRYLISRVLITSTMKSEPGTPPMRELDSSFGVPLSAAAICIVGGSAEGRRGTASVGAVVAACAGAIELEGNIIAAARPWEGFRHPLCVFNIRAGLSE